MNNGVRVPIRVGPRFPARRTPRRTPPVVEAVPPVTNRGPVTPAEPDVTLGRPGWHTTQEQWKPATARPEPKREEAEEEESAQVWRDRALRLQAEIDNFRKRQQRLAEERIVADRDRLLRSFLRVSDDLERALKAGDADAGSLRQGVDLTYQGLMKIMNHESVESIQAVGQRFDPRWHEAVSTVPHQRIGAEPDTVVEVVQTGYRLDDRLLRPARVIVAT